jgi:hypothetical protein
MAQRIVVTDDITGDEGAEPFVFVVDGDAYQIDLTDKSKGMFLDAVRMYIDAATPVTLPEDQPRHRRARTGKPGRTGGAGGGLDTTGMTQKEAREHTQAVREWGRAHGFQCTDRGRVPAEIVEAWRNRDQGNTVQVGPPEDDDDNTGEIVDDTPPVPVTDKVIVEWAKAKGFKVVGDRCTATLRTRYRTDNPGRPLAYDISKGAKTA